jgi:hypothetical protein
MSKDDKTVFSYEPFWSEPRVEAARQGLRLGVIL